MKTEKQLCALISQQFGIELTQQSEQEVLETLASRISELLAGDLENFMSMMYRMDVSEAKIRAALSPHSQEAPTFALARLIIERQLLRIATKQSYRQEPLDDWIDFNTN